jgi:menaquinone-dependent protoporphyrinogen oxidase
MDTPEFTFGKENPMSQRWLVAYATSAGSTIGVAAAIGETLGARGFAVDVKPIKSNSKIDDYQAVVIGSAVHGGRWLPEAITFVRDNQAALKRVPVALFCVHIMHLGADEKSRQNRQAYLNPVRPLLTPLDEVYFAGKGGDSASQSGVERWLSGLFNIPAGDQRDWNKIRGWATALNLSAAVSCPGSARAAGTLA